METTDIERRVATYIQQDFVQDTVAEFVVAETKFGKFNSAHEGYAVLKEEFDELWEVIRLKQSNLDRKKNMREEAVQVAAMALRFLKDCC